MIEFFAPCVPPRTTAQQKRTNRATGTFFKSRDLQAAENTFQAILLPFRPEAPVCGATSLEVTVIWPWLGKHKAKDRARHAVWMTSKPDADNWVKLLQDTLVTLRFIENDQSVCRLRVSKFWGENPGIHIKIEELS